MIEQPALQLGLWQVLDIVAVALILYQLYRLTRGTAAIRIFLGILAIYLVYQIVDALQMRMLAEILGQFIGVGVIALLIVFQQELRQFLLLIGNRQFVRSAPPWIQKWFGRNGNGQGAPSQPRHRVRGRNPRRRRVHRGGRDTTVPIAVGQHLPYILLCLYRPPSQPWHLHAGGQLP